MDGEHETGSAAAIRTRWMIGADMPAVMSIEFASFTSFTSWWSEEDFRRALRQRNIVGLVALCGFDVVGYMVYELHKSRFSIVNLAVHPDWRRRKIATQMVDGLRNRLSSNRFDRRRITLEIRERNLPGQLFFRSLGFKAITILPEFYDVGYGGRAEDAYLMQYTHKELASMELVGQE